MLFMTTNHIERLNAALIRPGRVDVRLEFTHASEDQITDFFIGFYQACTLLPTFSRHVPTHLPASSDVLQQFR